VVIETKKLFELLCRGADVAPMDADALLQPSGAGQPQGSVSGVFRRYSRQRDAHRTANT
jgi:hypothetical protein